MKNTSKKVLSSIVFIILCLGIVLSSNINNSNISYNKGETFSATYVVPNNLKELENSSDIIVKGYFNGDRAIDSDKDLVGPSSISKFEVKEVLKGDLKEDTISVLEPFKIEKGNFSNVEGYIPMEEDHEYMLYLRPNNTSKGIQYSIVSLNFGKYNISNNTGVSAYSRQITSFDEVADMDFITDSNEVCQRYNDIKSQITKEEISVNSYSAQILTKESAFYEFRVLPSNNVNVYLDKSITDGFANHTDAYNNAIEKISNISDTNIGFNRVSSDASILKLSSTDSSKEEWLGIARITYDAKTRSVPTFTKAQVLINDYKINSSGLTKDHTYQVALHELGHCFGLLHQDQLLEAETLMVPYVLPNRPGVTDYYNLDKHNLTYAYPKFNDYKDSWAKNQIEEFLERSFIGGYPDGSFRPDNNITRAEFVKILNKVFGLANTSGVVFTDTKTHWAKNDIDIAVTNGVAEGVSPAQFMPDKPITREQAAKMIASYKGLKSSEHTNLSKYSDANKVSSWAKDYVESVIKTGYMTGYNDNTFRPTNNITRAEAVVTFSRMIK